MNRPWIPILGAALAFALGGRADGQQPPGTNSGATVIVEGAVREVFQSVRRGGDALVQLDARRSELGRGVVVDRRYTIPAPGDPVYIHVPTAGVNGRAAVPNEGADVRAYLSPRKNGGWEGASAAWFEPAGDAVANRRGDDPAPSPAPAPAPAPSPTPAGADGGSILQTLGVKAERLNAGGRMVLKLTEIAPGSLAEKTGLEKGDVIIGANGQGFTSLDQFSDLLRKGGAAAELVVLNVNNGQQATVKLNMPDAPSAPDAPAPAEGPKRSLGVKVEPRRIGLRNALEVTELQPGGAAQQAGIEKGDVLMEADGVALTDAAQLQKVLDKAGPSLTIKVRDSRSGNDVPVEVQLGAAAPGSSPSPSPSPSPRPAPDSPAPPISGALTSKSFGIATEAGTVDLLPVVKVVKVTPGSAAEKAGLEAGDAITGVDDKVIFAPDLLDAALGKVGSKFTLTVLDPKTGKKVPVAVTLDR